MVDDRNRLLEELYTKHYDSVYRFCLVVAEFNPCFYPLIEDCIQDAFVKAILHYEKFEGFENQAGWLARVAGNRVRDEIRKERNRLRVISSRIRCKSEDMAFSDGEIDRALELKDLREEIIRIYNMLTDLEKRVFWSYFMEDKQIAEVASDNELSTNSVRAAVKRIRSKARLKNLLIFLMLLWCLYDRLPII